MTVIYAFVAFAAVWIGAALWFAGTGYPFTAVAFWVGSLIWLGLAKREHEFRN